MKRETQITLKKTRENHRLYFKELKAQGISFRIDRLRQFKKTIEQREDQIIQALAADLGKPHFESYTSEILMVQKEIDLCVKNLKNWAAPQRVSASLLNFPSQDYIIAEPYGTVLMISPWNYPFQLALIPLIGAIAAGNTVVLKPSESAPHTAQLLSALLGETFAEEWVQVIEGDADVAQELLKLQWDYIFFTGSTTVGKIIAQAAAVHLTPVTLELGGKSPCIVDGSTPLEKTARRIVFGKFLNCGQTCIAPDYVMVKKEYQQALVEALAKEIDKAFGKDNAQSKDYGRIIHEKHFDKLVADLNEQQIVYGGTHDKASLFFGPTLVVDPPRDSPLFREEVFGPILPLLSYETEEELDDVLSELKNPLAFYVFSSRKKFTQSLLLRYPFGGAVVNDSIIHFTNPNLPFGGVGQSGMGAYHGKHSFELFSHRKPIVKRSFWFDLPQRYAPYPKSLSTLKWILKKI
ncbi:aldehyde dehydrogenase [Flavobacteriaceae bacterium]|nr:aldehyde dehydrogenase [Flavobacteriaceae bacterium]MDA9015542.1 aldehyde dehydrogenase [Flavobacteriaceae bacterium]MDB3862416.1 aldehyde dehydrogenase [Flavobacteriaceae bacterium]